MFSVRSLYLFAEILYHLSDKTKAEFDKLLDQGIIDRAFRRAIDEKIVPDWFAEFFTFDPLDGILDGLRFFIIQSEGEGFIISDAIGHHFNSLTPSHLEELAQKIPMPIWEIREIARQIQECIDREVRENRA